MTNSVEKVEKLASNGAGAVVLKSIFEEEIALKTSLSTKLKRPVLQSRISSTTNDFQSRMLDHYISLIQESKKKVSIPVIASINCVYSHEWTAFARRIEQAGADAIELNMFFLPSDFTRSSQEQESAYFSIIDKILKSVSVPVALKISYYFSNLGPMIQKLSRSGVAGLVLFNRFFSPDIDIENLTIKPSFVFSTPAELAISLRWIAIMAQKVDCDLAASTGVHDGAAVIKQLLAGATAVQTVSSLYRKGPEHKTLTDSLKGWMQTHSFEKIAEQHEPNQVLAK
ncbi:MAG: dihydroorotate dehydrogenase-like protein, partial [Desulfobacterales bacterium]|nr:dihydroorotate dehydrogenase-like protein [Desulfobacterales bacterium]